LCTCPYYVSLRSSGMSPCMEVPVSGAFVHCRVPERVSFHKEVRSITSRGKFLRLKYPSPHVDTYEKLNHEVAILERWQLRCIATRRPPNVATVALGFYMTWTRNTICTRHPPTAYHRLHLLLLAQYFILNSRLGSSANPFLHRPFPFLPD